MLQFNFVDRLDRDGTANLTVFHNGEMYVADETHPRWSELLEKTLAKDESVVGLFNAASAAAERFGEFKVLSERVSVQYNRLYFDNTEISDAYGDLILELVGQGNEDDAVPYVNFLENVFTNTDEHTRENLSRWLLSANDNDGRFTITEDGYILGYKGLSSEGRSIHSGPAVVNGKAVNGQVENKPGSLITMDRSKVDHDPRRGCSVGLHVGTWNYAHGFGSIVAEVLVNPRDVVSVPTECGDQKMRVSRYTVVRYVDEKRNEKVVSNDFVPSEDYFDEEEFERGYAEGYSDGYDEGYADGEYAQ